MEERNLLLTVAYDGSGFSGWQRQPSARTAQGALEEALSRLVGEPVAVTGCSRTDAGVHALDQKACLRGCFGIPADRVAPALNNLLNTAGPGHCGDIRVLNVQEMPLGFHPRFSSKGKKYIYKLRCGGEADLFRRLYCYQPEHRLDAAAMNEAAAYLVGEHDFRSFMASGSTPQESTVRTIYRLAVEEEEKDGAQELTLEVRGNGFLYNMVRIITGTLVEVGRGKRSPLSVKEALEALDRSAAGHTAPPEGLYLARIYYDQTELEGK